MGDDQARSDEPHIGDEDEPEHSAPVYSLIVAASRFGVLFGIVGTILAGFVLFAYGALAMIRELWNKTTDGWPDVDGAKALAVVAIQVTDLFLLGTVLNIVAMGLFQLFIDPTMTARLPTWLQVTSLDQLKSKLVGVIAVLLGVSFLATVVEWDGTRNVIYLGGAIAVVIVALGLLTSVLDRDPEFTKSDAPE